MKKTAKRFISLGIALGMILPMLSLSAMAVPATSTTSETPVTLGDGGEYSLDLNEYADQWQYATCDSTDYWWLDVVYCANPTVISGDAVQVLRIYAPAAYMVSDENSDVVLTENEVTSTSGVTYTAASAPIIYRNKSGGYGASSIQEMSSSGAEPLTGYLDEGYVIVSIQTRGKETQDDNGDYIGQFPAVIVDLKAGIRYLKANADVVPGNPERIISAGHSSGGGVSAMLGASGNASVFDPYLVEIGAADTSDDIFITMASAPVTNLSTADASYEWYQYGATEYFLFNAMNKYSYDDTSGLTPFVTTGTQYYFELGGNTLGGTHEDELSEVLKDLYVEYIQELGFDLDGDGHSGDYWDGFVQLHTDGLNTYIGRMSDAEAEAYVKGLTNWESWIDWDDESKTATITDFTGMLENYVPRKNMVLSVDTVNYLGNENDAFVSADGTREHFSTIARDALDYLLNEYNGTGWTGEELLGTKYTNYSAAKPLGGTVVSSGTWTDTHRALTQEASLEYLESLCKAYNDGVTGESAYILDVMSPTSYILGEEDFDDADISPYWRLRFGGTDGGVSIPEAWFMANALEENHPDVDVHIGVEWTFGHSFAEMYISEFYAYIDEAMVESGETSADDVINDIHAIGFVDADGTKLSAIAVEYNFDLMAGSVDENTYEISNYVIGTTPELGVDPGEITKVYVNNEAAISETGGVASGKYVIIEVNTDYQLAMAVNPYKLAMIAGVTQNASITTGGTTITPNTEEIVNYTGEGSSRRAIDGKFTILGTEVFDLYSIEDGTAFHATDCFEEADGQLYDVDLPYALFVPEDYDASGKYALVLHVHDAGTMGSDPMLTITEAQGPMNFASDEVQQLAKDEGLDGIILVAPSLDSSLRSTRDNWTTSRALGATWQLVDDIIERYSIDSDRIYATGQSMGAMQVLSMAAQRDNFFAALWPIGFKWGSNFDKSFVYNGASYYASQDKTIWTVDADGNPCDWENWYYMISDDNILWTNCLDDPGASLLTREMQYLFYDLTGVKIPFATVNPLEDSKADQSAAIKALTSQSSDIGIYWLAFEGGSHSGTWIYGHGNFGGYEWLLSQTRESEMERDKLDLDKPFELADEQIETDERVIFTYDESSVYFATGKYGSGTANYNTGIYNINQKAVLRAPGANNEPVAEVRTAVFTLYPKRSTLVVEDEDGNTITPEADGSYLLSAGNYTYTVSKTNYTTAREDFTVSDQDLDMKITLDADVDLTIYKDLDFDPNTWYLGHVEYSVANNLFVGIGDDEWGPNIELNRAMFVTALGKFEGVDTSQYSTCDFTDVADGTYYTAYVQWAYNEGLVAGVGDGKFEPDRAIARQEIAQIFMVYAEYCGIDMTDQDDTAFKSFPDHDKTSDWAIPAMIWAAANEVIKGDGTNLNSLGNTTRAEAASIFRLVIEDIIP